MNLPLGYVNGQFVSASELSVPVSDLGFVNGATITEQTRTFNSKIFELDRHLDRFWCGLTLLRIDSYFDREKLRSDLNELVQKNHSLIDGNDDLGLCFFATPGRIESFDAGMANGSIGNPENVPTIRAHTYPLPFARWAKFYSDGFDLVRSSFQETPSECWPKNIKCRSRMQYYLAELEAAEISPGSKPILTDSEGNVRDSSISSLVFYDNERGLLTPGGDASLSSVSVDVIGELASELGIPFSHADVPYESIHDFYEVMLVTTPWCVAPVKSVDGKTISDASGRVFAKLISRWSETVDVDIVTQAKQFTDRD